MSTEETRYEDIARFGWLIQNVPGLVEKTHAVVNRLNPHAALAGACVTGVDAMGEPQAVASAWAGCDVGFEQARALHNALERAHERGMQQLFGLIMLSRAAADPSAPANNIEASSSYPDVRCVRQLRTIHLTRPECQGLVADDLVILAAGLREQSNVYRTCTLDELALAYDNPDLPEAEELFSRLPTWDPGFEGLPLRRRLFFYIQSSEEQQARSEIAVLSPAAVACRALTQSIPPGR